jgi:polysaccharide export outer membrane protein
MKLPYRTISALASLALWASTSSRGQTGGTTVVGPVVVAGPAVPVVQEKLTQEKLAQQKLIENKAGTLPVPPNPTPVGPQVLSDAPGQLAGSPVQMTPAPAVPPAAKPTVPKAKGKKSKDEPEPLPPVSAEEKPYVIGSLDVLEIKVWNDPKLSGIVDVRPDGIVNMPLIGEMRADGLTVMELTQLIKGKLAATVMEDPEVTIQVARINSKKFYILGGCLRQGEFPLIAPTTVLDAFASCGGFKDFANQKKIYVLRGNKRFPFNYRDVSQGKHMEQNVRLQNGDRIVVPE